MPSRYRLLQQPASLEICGHPIPGRRRGRPLPFELPEIKKADDLMPALNAVREATAQGKITPAECRTLGGFVESHRKVIEAVVLEKRLCDVESIAAKDRRIRDAFLDVINRSMAPTGQVGAIVPAPVA